MCLCNWRTWLVQYFRAKLLSRWLYLLIASLLLISPGIGVRTNVFVAINKWKDQCRQYFPLFTCCYTPVDTYATIELTEWTKTTSRTGDVQRNIFNESSAEYISSLPSSISESVPSSPSSHPQLAHDFILLTGWLAVVRRVHIFFYYRRKYCTKIAYEIHNAPRILVRKLIFKRIYGNNSDVKLMPVLKTLLFIV